MINIVKAKSTIESGEVDLNEKGREILLESFTKSTKPKLNSFNSTTHEIFLSSAYYILIEIVYCKIFFILPAIVGSHKKISISEIYRILFGLYLLN